MGAPRGNNNAVGNCGGGRKSAYQEYADAELLWKVFTEQMDTRGVAELLGQKHSIKDVWIAGAHAGNEKFIQQIVHKLFPDRREFSGPEREPIQLHANISEALEKIYGGTEPEK